MSHQFNRFCLGSGSDSGEFCCTPECIALSKVREPLGRLEPDAHHAIDQAARQSPRDRPVIGGQVESRSHRGDIAKRPSHQDVQASVNVLMSIHSPGHLTVELLEGAQLVPQTGLDHRLPQRIADPESYARLAEVADQGGLALSHVGWNRGIGKGFREIEVQPDRHVALACERRGTAGIAHPNQRARAADPTCLKAAEDRICGRNIQPQVVRIDDQETHGAESDRVCR